jgi:hypothetical protein
MEVSMKKVLIILAMVIMALVIPTSAMAADPPPGIVTINASGNNGGTVVVNSVMPYVQDSLTLTSNGVFGLNQSNRFLATGQWTGDGNDIDRSATFTGTGSINTISSYLSTDPWAVGAATLTSSVTSVGTGGLHQNLYFDQNYGGVYTQSQWAKQRDMQADASGNYVIDVNNVGASIAPSLGSFPGGVLPAYAFDINSKATTGSTILQFNPNMAIGREGLSNETDHGRWTGMNTNFILAYTNAPIIGTTIQAGAAPGGGIFTITVDTINKIITGYGTIK